MKADAQTFKAGDLVPDWLLSVVPVKPSAAPFAPALSFAVDCVVTSVEGVGHYINALSMENIQTVLTFVHDPGTSHPAAIEEPVSICTAATLYTPLYPVKP